MDVIKKITKRLLVLLITISAATVSVSAAVHESHPYEFEIRRDPYRFATYFQISSKDTYIGSVKKSAFRLRRNYDLSDKNGWQATGIVRILTLGTLFSWASEIDVYDTRGVKFGMIDGQVMTTENAKFSLYEYDDEGNYTHIGTAFLDGDFDSFTILSPEGTPHPIAKLERCSTSVGKKVDYWKTQVYHPESIDDRLIRIFSAFIMDHQDDFQGSRGVNNQV